MTTDTPAFYAPLLLDHQETQRMLNALDTLLKMNAPSWDSVQSLFTALCTDLDRHFACEEHSLFPVLSQYRSMILMEVEHDDLLLARERVTQGITAAFTQRETPSDDLLQDWEAFKTLLESHMREEEQGIFPLAEARLEPEEKALVARKLNDLLVKAQSPEGLAELLHRPTPEMTVFHTRLFDPVTRPMAYEHLFEQEHVKIQHIAFQAGSRQSLHWAPEIQALLVISGKLLLHTKTDTQSLSPGSQVTLEPRFYYALEAQTEAHILAVKVWPRPHFTRA